MQIQEAIQLAIGLLKAGQLDDAERVLAQIVAQRPDVAEAYHIQGLVRRQRGDNEGALRHLDAAIAADAGVAVSHNNRAEILRLLGRTADAAQGYRKALALKPDFLEALNNLGAALKDLGQFDEALACYRELLRRQPGYALGHMHLGTVLQRLGQVDDAFACYERAIALDSGLAAAHMHRGTVLEARGRLDEALAAYRRSTELRPDVALAQTCLGVLLHRLGRSVEAHACLTAAITLDPGCLEAQGALDNVTEALAPARDVPMLNDPRIAEAFGAAMRRVVEPRHLVLDPDAGPGLLSMVAAKAGAERVVGCGVSAPVAAVAREAVARNGLSGRVEIVPRPSRELEVGRDLPRRADLLVLSPSAGDLLSGGLLGRIEDAWARLLDPSARVVPETVTIQGALVGGPDVERLVNLGTLAGLDLSPMNALRPRQVAMPPGTVPDMLSVAFELFRFDLRTRRFEARRRDFAVPAAKTGLCYGVVRWVSAGLAPGHIFEQRPGAVPGGAWPAVLHTFETPVRLSMGERLAFAAWHDRSRIMVVPAARKLGATAA
ncbi:tetratricopeptide repeat protein [Arenibaculum pallidiluteum]|uniref:tetratricopeptide repeat protein n=1 Tax=Arenibaculum pallidiluteum TaxID=2812559 RepID=UPI001A966BA5|nr:tetratricopeptide repeat protein [Arenibaculum pallidiluteum]